MIRAAIYARVSSAQQAERELSIPEQLRACREHAQRQGWQVAGEYVDEAYTGLSDDRPQFQRMIADAQSGAIEAVIAYTADRFARSRLHAVTYKALLRQKGIELAFAAEVTISGPEGILLEAMSEAIAEWYSHRLSEVVKRGQGRRRQQGHWNGGNPAFGYRYNGEGLAIDEAEAAIVRQIYAWLIEGVSYVNIIMQLREAQAYRRCGRPWRNISHIRRLIENPSYAGLCTIAPRWPVVRIGDKRQRSVPQGEWQLIPTDKWPPIIEVETWRKAQQIVQARSHRNATPAPYLYSGLLRCPQCGGKLVGRTYTKRQVYTYYCNAFPRMHKGREYRREALEAAVTAELHRIGIDRGTTFDVAPRPNSTVAAGVEVMETRITQLEHEIEALKLAYERGIYGLEEFARRLQRKQADIESARVALVEERAKPPQVTPQFVVARLRDIFAADLPYSALRAELSAVIHSIEILQEPPLPWRFRIVLLDTPVAWATGFSSGNAAARRVGDL